MALRPLAIFIAAAAFALGGIVTAACSSDDSEATPSRPPIPVTDANPGNDGNVDTDGGDGGVDAACVGDGGCFACAPAQTIDYLNACTDNTCTPFDNVARLPLYKAGQPLPALP